MCLMEVLLFWRAYRKISILFVQTGILLFTKDELRCILYLSLFTVYIMEKISLRDAFVKREKRFLLLDSGCERAGFDKSAALLEIGCAGGEAAAYMWERGYERLSAIDIDAEIIEAAKKAAPNCRIMQADACALPFEEESFDGLFSEAAFALIPDKAAAAAEYYRVLKGGGRLLVNDFALRLKTGADRRCMEGIPMLMGVQTMALYKDIFEKAGFRCVYESEEFAELIRIAISLSKTYGISPTEVGKYIVSAFGRDEFVNDFFSQTQMSYCQMIFEKV